MVSVKQVSANPDVGMPASSVSLFLLLTADAHVQPYEVLLVASSLPCSFMRCKSTA